VPSDLARSDTNEVGNDMEAGLRRTVAVSIIVAVGLSIVGGPASASTWSAPLRAGSTGLVKAQAVPSAPTGASATCVSSSVQQVTVLWSAVTHASSYTVYDSTTSSTGTFSAIATGVIATNWTSGTLSAGNYWFKVAAYVGSNWVSAQSTVTAESTTSTGNTRCTQPYSPPTSDEDRPPLEARNPPGLSPLGRQCSHSAERPGAGRPGS
jgi:hypothetical protein